MSIHLPEYAREPPPLVPRSERVRAIWVHAVGERVGALNVVLLAFLFTVVLLTLVFNFAFAASFGREFGSAPLLSYFLQAYSGGPGLAGFFFLVLLVSSVGARIISGDLSTRAITMYLGRPITPLDYLTAKASAVGFWVLLGAVAPGEIGDLIVLSLGYIPLSVALTASVGILALGFSLVVATTGLALLFSSLTARSTLAGAGIFGFLVGSEAIAGVFAAVTGNSTVLYGGFFEDEGAVAAAAFGVSGNPLDPVKAGAVLLGFGIAALLLAYLKLQRTEVVSE